MTYTAIARDGVTGQLGIAIATYSLAVGASCPYIRPGVGAVSTQAATYPAHGPALLDMLENGTELSEAIASLSANDRNIEYRQIGAVTTDGEAHAFTGSSTRDWAGSMTGQGWLVMGNVLAGEQVVLTMGEALESSANQPLTHRLMAALEAGHDAGGQAGLENRRLPERSAVLTVYGAEQFPELDLRVDDHPNAVTELRRVFDRFMQVDQYYRDRAERPDSTPPQDLWMAEHGIE